MAVAHGMLRRIGHVARARRYDLVLDHRNSALVGSPYLERRLARLRIPYQGYRHVVGVGVEPSAGASAAARTVAGLEVVQCSWPRACSQQRASTPSRCSRRSTTSSTPARCSMSVGASCGRAATSSRSTTMPAPSARILGDRSPIVGIEQAYLFDPRTMTARFAMHGFAVLRSGLVRKRLSLRYLGQVQPLPDPLHAIYDTVARGPLGALAPWLPPGNLPLIGGAG